MQFPDNRLSTQNLTLFAIYAGALLYFAAVLPEIINYTTNPAVPEVNHTPLTLAALTFFGLVLFAMARLYKNGHRHITNTAIIAIALSTPFVFDSHAFLPDQVPKGIWLSFVLALAVSQLRVAFIALAVSFGLAFFTYQEAFRSSHAIVETIIIFVLLILGRFMLNRIINDVNKDRHRQKMSQFEVPNAAQKNKPSANPSVATTSTVPPEDKNLVVPAEQHHAFIRYAPISMAVLDLEMNYIACSEKWQQENNRGYDNLIGRNHYEVNPDIPHEWKTLYQQALDGNTITNVEFVWQQNNGTQRWLRCSLKPWEYEDGKLRSRIGGIIISLQEITDHKIAESDLHSVLEESGDAIWICDAAGHFIYANPAASELTGYIASELTNLRLADIIHEEREDELLEYLALTKYSKFTRGEWTLKHKNGSTVSVELTTGHLPGERMIALARDLTEKKQTESERFKLFQAVEQSPGCIMITNLEGEIEYVNAAFLKRTGYVRKEILGKNPRIIKSGKTPTFVFSELWKAIKQGRTWQGEISNVSKNGQEFVLFSTISPIRQSNGNISNYIAIGEDITGRKKDEERIFELAYFDQLTGLPNRTLLLDRLNQVIAISSRSNAYGALLFIDLDHFKNINDTFGHQKGDMVLKQVAECLMLRIREGDTVARFGGDEFVVLLTELGTDDDVAANKAQGAAIKLLEALNQTYQLGEVIYHSTASIGVAMFNGKHSSSNELLKQADLAMYNSKKVGRNTLRFFDPSLESAMKQHATMEEDLRSALKNNQFILHYQGQFTSESKLTGAEVLLRWKHPVQGMMPPALFIPFAEETGLILPIGNWVLETACTQLAVWGKIPTQCELVLAVNVSALQFRQSDFIETILSIVSRTGANPHRLKLELTESMLIENLDDVIQKMLTLKRHGIGFSLDDFGTGYSSLSFLKRLPLDQLKIDQSFICDVHNDPNGAAIAKIIVSLGKSLGLNVIAEGVETTEQRTFLANAGCYAYQGYLFGHPLAIQEFDSIAIAISTLVET